MESNNFRFYEFGGFKLDARRRILLKNGEQVPLSARIFDLLLVFVQNEGKILEHDELLDKVWEGAFVEQSNLKKSVSALRQILGENPNESLYIKTVPRRGYSFVAPVHAIGDEEIFNDSGQPKKSFEPQSFWQKSRPQVLAAVFGLLILAAAFGAWKIWFQTGKNNNFRLENLKIQKLTTTGNVFQAALSPDGKTVVYATTDNLDRQTLWSKRIGQPNALQIAPAAQIQYQYIAVSPDNNTIYFAAAQNNSQRDFFRLPISGGATARKIIENTSSNATFSPDGKSLAFVRDAPDKIRRLIIANAEDGSGEREIYAVSDNHQLIAPAWSPDGKKFAFVSSEVTKTGRTWTLMEISAEGGATRAIFPPQKEKVYMANWLRDGSGLIATAEPKDSRQTQLWQISYPGGEISRLTNDVSGYDDVFVSDDGKALLSVQTDKIGDLWTMNWTMLQNTTRLTDTQNLNGAFCVLPDGKILAETTENGQFGFQIFNRDGTNPQPFFQNINSERTPNISPDGKSVLYVSRRSGTQEIWKTDIDGRNSQKLTEEKSFLLNPRFSPDGKEIFLTKYDDSNWRLAKMPASGGAITYLAEEVVYFYSFSPDGKSIAYNFRDDQNKRWKVAVRNISDNQLQKQFDIAPSSLLEWSPDGKNLIYNVSEIFLDGGSLWLQPLDGSPPKPLLETKDDRIFQVAWSPDRQKLFMTRGKTISNIVLLTKNNP